jgi:putative tryptophan/tyrosine transport system substrate-binding protein
MMRRRPFIALVGGAAAAWPLAARAQQGERTPRIGFLTTLSENDPEVKGWLAAFQAEMQKLGWTLGRNFSIEARWPGSNEQRLRSSAAELVKMAPDLIFATTTPALAALHRESRSLPIVFVQVSDPVKLGFVGSLARPGGNITGFTTFEYPVGGKWLELLKDTAPGRSRVAVLHDPDNPSQVAYLQGVEAAAPTFGMQLTRADVRNATDIERAINDFAQQTNGALVVAPTAVTILHRDLIIVLAAQHRLPAVYPYRYFAANGGFISYGVDLAEQYRQAAGYVDRILRGANPGELPVQLSSKFELVVNLKTAKALGLTIPELFLQRADEVIE